MRPRCRSGLMLLLVVQTVSYAQSITPEAFVGVGLGRLFRIEDLPMGSGWNLGGGAGLLHRSGLGIEFEFNRTLGLSAEPARCSIVRVPCEGSARQGVTSAAILSFNTRYEIGSRRLRPYVTGGAGALVSEGFRSSVFVSDQRAVLREERWSDTGLAINVGAGTRIQLTDLLSLRAELRVYFATALSRENLNLFRPCIVLAWSW